MPLDLTGEVKEYPAHKSDKTINFEDRVAALREYKEKNGHLSVSKKDDESLFNGAKH
jgi:aconitase B